MLRSVDWLLFTDVSEQSLSVLSLLRAKKSNTNDRLKMGPMWYPKTSIDDYQSTPHNIQK
jgi:hypothetical protein